MAQVPPPYAAGQGAYGAEGYQQNRTPQYQPPAQGVATYAPQQPPQGYAYPGPSPYAQQGAGGPGPAGYTNYQQPSYAYQAPPQQQQQPVYYAPSQGGLIAYNPLLGPSYRNYMGGLYAALSVVILFAIISAANPFDHWFAVSFSGTNIGFGWKGASSGGFNGDYAVDSFTSAGKFAVFATLLDILLGLFAMLLLTAVAFPCTGRVRAAVNQGTSSTAGWRLLRVVCGILGVLSLLSLVGAIEFLAVFRDKYTQYVSCTGGCDVKYQYAWVLLVLNVPILGFAAVSAWHATRRLHMQQMSEDATRVAPGVYGNAPPVTPQ